MISREFALKNVKIAKAMRIIDLMNQQELSIFYEVLGYHIDTTLNLTPIQLKISKIRANTRKP